MLIAKETLSRRLWLQAATALATVAAAPAAHVRAASSPSDAVLRTREANALPSAESLRDAIQQAVKRQQPLVVMVSLHGCRFCQQVRQSVLLPMLRSGEATVVQVDMRSAQRVLDAAGQATTHDQLVRGWKVTIAPTLLFLGPDGKEVAERMVGAMLPDYYASYVTQRIEDAKPRLASRG